MALQLPPRSIIRPDAATAQKVHDELTSVIVGHPQATTTYRFYEEIDTWLGPWGNRGYPIGYGKFYNIAFNSNEKLRSNPTTRQWIWRTTIRLQEALRDYLVGRVRDGTIGSLTEPELRQAAFDSHPRAYDQGGLTTVVLAAPEMLPIIVSIPGVEFLPWSQNFSPTWRQVVLTLERIAPQVVGGTLATAAGPAHTGIFRRALQRDQQNLLNEMAMGRELSGIKARIGGGDLDNIAWLDEIIRRLNVREFPDQGFARYAGEVVAAAQHRRQELLARYRQLLNQSPEIKSRVERRCPEVTGCAGR